MDPRIRAAEAYLLAMRTGEVPATESAARFLAEDVKLNGATVWGRQGATLEGKKDVLYRITGEWPNTPVYVKGFWSEPRLEGDKVKIDATFPAMGMEVKPVLITKIVDADGNIVEQYKPEPPKRRIPADTIRARMFTRAAPTGGTFTSLFTPAMNNRGQVAFETEMTGGPAEFAIVRGDGITLTPVFVADQIAPGGATFQDFGDPLINKQGQVVAVASLVNGASGAGLFIGDGANAVAIALDGQPAPKGGSYSASFDKPLTTNDRGEVAFSARLKGGTSPRGIFRWNAGETTTLALAGTIAPGTTGTFASFGDMKLGNDGRVAFIGTLVPGVGGVDFSNNMGIWVGTSDADLQLVVRTGEVIDGKVLMRLPSGLGQFDMNDDAIVWIGTFPSRSTAVVFSRTRSESEDTQDRDSHHQR